MSNVTNRFPHRFALLIWWFSTGIILYMIGLNRSSYPYTLVISASLLVAALSALSKRVTGTQPGMPISAFACAVVVWGFVEMTFLTGYVTGSRKTQCPPDSSGWRRVRYATETIIYHELLLIAAGVAVIAATWTAATISPWRCSRCSG